MKLVHLILRLLEDDVLLPNGELFMVKWAPYAQYLANPPPQQPVSFHRSSVSFWTKDCQEIKM
jgi:hypothetical protein